MSKELENQIEAILFASGKGLTIDDINKICDEKPQKIKNSLKKLQENYDERECSLHITKHIDKWKLTVRSKYVPHIEKLVSETELAQAILKTLAMVAFKSPVLQSEIIDIRGQGAYDHIKELVKDKFVTKEPHGRSYILKITDKFYEYFDVEGDDEIRDVFSRLKKEQEEKLGELEVIDIKEDAKIKEIHSGKIENQNNLSTLKVVDVEEKDETNEQFKRDEIVQQRKEQKQEDKKFLSDIDSKIEQLSQRVSLHKDEEKTDQNEKEDSSQEDDEVEISKENNDEENSSENNDENQKSEVNYI